MSNILPNADHYPLNGLIISTKKYICTGLKNDIKRLGVHVHRIRTASSMQAAMAEIQEDMPNVVFLSLDIPERFAVARFFEQFQPSRRRFALIILHEPTQNAASERHLMRYLVAQDLSGYLEIGRFGNKALFSALEAGWLKVRHYHLSATQRESVQAFINTMRHPLFTMLGQSESDFSGEQTSVRVKGQYGENIDIQWDKIVRIEMMENYSNIWCFDHAGNYLRYIVRSSSTSIVVPPIMRKIHRSHRIHLAYIKAVNRETIDLINGETLPLGRTYRNEILELLEGYSPPFFMLSLLKTALPQTLPHTLAPTEQNAESLSGTARGGGQEKYAIIVR
jgi:hypothetical protein